MFDRKNYIITTRSEKYKSWKWYIELQEKFVVKEHEYENFESDAFIGKLPINIGVEFSRWILGNPEILDIVYRRFILEEYDNKLEANLLHDAAIYFSYKNNYGDASRNLIYVYRRLVKVITGEIDSVESDEYKRLLLSVKGAFE